MLLVVDLPDGTKVDGAVVELSMQPDVRFTATADVRIPAPEAVSP